jgi:acyl-CoA thioesterase FadM
MGSLLVVKTRLKRLGNTSAEYRHEVLNAETGELHSTSEQVTVLFDLDRRAAAPLTDDIRARGAALGIEA